jgi:amino acid transporter
MTVTPGRAPSSGSATAAPVRPSDASSGPSAASAGGPELYTRQSSGLVRSISLSSSIYMNLTTIGLIFAILVITATPTGFPHSDPVLMAVLTTVVCLGPALLYGVWTAIAPRSGADYVWNSRAFHPWVGFAANFAAVSWFILGNGFLAWDVATDGLPTAFYMIGHAFHSSTIIGWGTTVSGKNWAFAIGILVLVLSAVACGLGMRRTVRLMVILLGLTVAGVVLSLFILLFNSHSDFVHAVARNGGNYNAVIAAAAKSGYHTGHYSLGVTLLSMPPLYLALGYSVASAYAGGELRTARTTGLWGPIGAVIIAGLLIIVTFAAASSTIGFPFIGAATTLSNAGSKAYPFAHGANYFFFVSLLTTSKVWSLILGIAYIAAPLSALLVTALYTTRAVFAWSFDRILPDRLAGVDMRTGAPIPALIYVTVLALIYLVFIRLFTTTTLQFLGSVVIGSSFAFMFAALGAMILPFIKRGRSLYESSPFRGSIAGIPVLSLVGAWAFVIYTFMFISSLTQDPVGANSAKGLIAQAIVLAIAVAIFPISRWLNRRRGVNLGLLGKELPPE